jgi:hypothetical protein
MESFFLSLSPSSHPVPVEISKFEEEKSARSLVTRRPSNINEMKNQLRRRELSAVLTQTLTSSPLKVCLKDKASG